MRAPKTRWEELAIAGGEPAFELTLHVGRPNIGDRQAFLDRMNAIFDRRWLTNNGTYLQQFEEAVAERAGVRHGVAVCNATLALQLAARALDLTGEVIVPAFTFVATAHAMQWEGLTPVFCDVNPVTMQLDPVAVERLITERTSAIVPVHLWGQAADPAGFERLAQRHGLSLLFDAAHAFGCAVGDRPVGCFGNAEVFSFHATKFVNSFEGGAIVTNDDALADRLRRMRNFGFADYDLVVGLGTNAKMSEPAAAMGLTSIESMAEFVARNRENFAHYRAGLHGVPGVRLLDPAASQRSNYQYVVLQITSDAAMKRDELYAALQAENVLARRYFHPGVHRMEPYGSMPRYADVHVPITDRLSEEVLCLPTGTAVTEAEIAAICAIIRTALGRVEGLSPFGQGVMKVSVSITTFNHARYIRQAVESVLSQQCRVRVELIVGDDCSTDGTSDVLAELERENRGSLKVIRPAANLGQQGLPMFLETLKHCDGAFVAMLDGDDYWTDDTKLERQLDFLSRHEDCSLCHHGVENVYDNAFTEPWRSDAGATESLVGFDALLPWHSIGSPTPLVRQEVVRALPPWTSRSPFGDWPIYMAAADIGRIGYLPRVMAAYRFHGTGVWTQLNAAERQQQVVDFFAAINGGILRRHPKALLHAMTFHLLELAARHREQGILVDRAGVPLEWLGTEGLAGFSAREALQPSEEFSTAVVRLLDVIGGELLLRNRRFIARVLSGQALLLAQRSLERGNRRPALHMVRNALRADPGTTLRLASTLLLEQMPGFMGAHAR